MSSAPSRSILHGWHCHVQLSSSCFLELPSERPVSTCISLTHPGMPCRGGRILKVVVGAAVLAGAAFGALKLAENKGMKLELKRTPGVDTVQERKKKFPF